MTKNKFGKKVYFEGNTPHYRNFFFRRIIMYIDYWDLGKIECE